MKLFLAVAALLAFTRAAPTTHTLEVGSNGVVGSVDLASPLVSIVVNVLNDAQSPALVPGAVNEPAVDAEPVAVVDTPALADPVIVVDTPVLADPVIVVDTPVLADPVIVVDTPAIASLPVVVVDSPAEANPVDVISVSPIVIVPNPIDVISVSPVEINPIDVISTNPVIVEPAEQPQPVQVVDVTPGLASVDTEAGSTQIINVIMNFVFGSDGSVSSVELPAQSVQQLVGVARG